MTKNIKKYSLDINGNELSVEVGRVANLANGSCVLTLGRDSSFSNSICPERCKEGVDFLPMTVDVQEKAYALGKLREDFQTRRKTNYRCYSCLQAY